MAREDLKLSASAIPERGYSPGMAVEDVRRWRGQSKMGSMTRHQIKYVSGFRILCRAVLISQEYLFDGLDWYRQGGRERNCTG